MKFKQHFFYFILILCLISSCRTYNPDRMFKTEENIKVDSIQKLIAKAERNYIIEKNDYLNVDIYTNKGEKLIDPNQELNKGGSSSFQNSYQRPQYLIRIDGKARLPMVGEIPLRGKTLAQADSILEIEYGKFYEDPFIYTSVLNKRVTVLGPGGGKVIMLANENMNLLEVLALYGGLTERGKAYNIKIVRGDLKNPDVSIIDLSTIEGMRQANLTVLPNDVIYVSSTRSIIGQTFREISPIISLLTTFATLFVLLRTRF